MPAGAAAFHREDMRTRHAALFGTTGPYSAPPEAVLAGLTALNAPAIFAFWNEVAPGALPSVAEIAAARGHDWAALSAQAEAGADAAA